MLEVIDKKVHDYSKNVRKNGDDDDAARLATIKLDQIFLPSNNIGADNTFVGRFIAKEKDEPKDDAQDQEAKQIADLEDA